MPNMEVLSMAKKRSYRRGYRAGKRRARKGWGMPKLLDVSQIVVNADGLGYITAGEQAIAGDFKAAAGTVAAAATSPAVIIGLSFDNLLIGVGRKIIHKTGGKWVRKVVA